MSSLEEENSDFAKAAEEKFDTEEEARAFETKLREAADLLWVKGSWPKTRKSLDLPMKIRTPSGIAIPFAADVTYPITPIIEPIPVKGEFMDFDGEEMLDALAESDDDIWNEDEAKEVGMFCNQDWDDLDEVQQNRVLKLHQKLLARETQDENSTEPQP